MCIAFGIYQYLHAPFCNYIYAGACKKNTAKNA